MNDSLEDISMLLMEECTGIEWVFAIPGWADSGFNSRHKEMKSTLYPGGHGNALFVLAGPKNQFITYPM